MSKRLLGHQPGHEDSRSQFQPIDQLRPNVLERERGGGGGGGGGIYREC